MNYTKYGLDIIEIFTKKYGPNIKDEITYYEDKFSVVEDVVGWWLWSYGFDALAECSGAIMSISKECPLCFDVNGFKVSWQQLKGHLNSCFENVPARPLKYPDDYENDIIRNPKFGSDHPIVAFGEKRSCGVYINYSSILTKLIQEAGKYCTHYASDLFIEWEYILRAMDSGSFEGGTWMFAFRDMGVDSSVEYASTNEYKAVWQLDIEVNEHVVRMTLQEKELKE